MSIEERLRESLRRQVETPPEPRDLADRSVRGAARVRRRQAGTAVALFLLLAVAAPMALNARSTKDLRVVTSSSQTAANPTISAESESPGPATTGIASPEPALGVTATMPSTLDQKGRLKLGARPLVEYVADAGGLRRPRGAIGAREMLPAAAWNYREVLSAGGYTIAFSPHTTDVIVVGPDGSFRKLAGGTLAAMDEPSTPPDEAVLGVAADAPRLAYSIQHVDAERNVTSTLVLIDLASGKELQRLDGPQARPVDFSGDRVFLAVGDGAETSAGLWLLESNSLAAWPESAGDLPLDAVGDVLLMAEGDNSCVAVWDIAAENQRFSTCVAGRPSDEVDRFGALSPDGKRYAGLRYVDVDRADSWPVIGDAQTGKTDDRLRSTFDAALLHVDQSAGTSVVWEDASHILVLAVDEALEGAKPQLLVRCDVDAVTCEIAYDSRTSSYSEAHVNLARPVY